MEHNIGIQTVQPERSTLLNKSQTLEPNDDLDERDIAALEELSRGDPTGEKLSKDPVIENISPVDQAVEQTQNADRQAVRYAQASVPAILPGNILSSL